MARAAQRMGVHAGRVLVLILLARSLSALPSPPVLRLHGGTPSPNPSGARTTRTDSVEDMMPPMPKKGQFGCSRSGSDQTPSWTDLRHMAESCAEYFELQREGGDPGKARRSAERLSSQRSLSPAPPTPPGKRSGSVPISPPAHEDLKIIKQVLAKAEESVIAQEAPPRAGGERFFPHGEIFERDNNCLSCLPAVLGRMMDFFDCVFNARMKDYLFNNNDSPRSRHDEVCYRENTFPKAKRYASADWLHILWTWPQSTVMIRILSPVLVTTAWTALLALIHSGLPRFVVRILRRVAGWCKSQGNVGGAGTSPAMPANQYVQGLVQGTRGVCMGLATWFRWLDGGAQLAFLKGFSKQPHSIVGSAMSLLLVFRTNTAYTRFWEGRCLWENVSDYLRDIVRFCVVYRNQLGESNVKRIADLLCAFPVALKHHLEGYMGHDQEDELSRLVDPLDLPGVLSAVNRPQYICSTLMHIIVHDVAYQADAWTVRERLLLCAIFNSLSKCIGGCERLVQTPVPLHYARHAGRFMGLFVLSLPLILIDDMGLLAVPAVAITVWALYGVQEIGLLIENPFARCPADERLDGECERASVRVCVCARAREREHVSQFSR